MVPAFLCEVPCTQAPCSDVFFWTKISIISTVYNEPFTGLLRGMITTTLLEWLLLVWTALQHRLLGQHACISEVDSACLGLMAAA